MDVGPTAPFAGLSPAASGGDADWWATTQPSDGVGFRVPLTFESVVRIHHRLRDGRRWADAYPSALRPGSHADSVDAFTIPVAQFGALDNDVVDALVPLLRAATTTPNRCHFGLWVGWGGLTVGSTFPLVAVDAAPNRQPWRAMPGWRARRRSRASEQQQRLAASLSREHEFIRDCAVVGGPLGRDMLLMDGPIESVSAIGLPGPWGDGSLYRYAPQRWWPHDRAWFVGSDVDDPWTYVAGPEALAAAVETLPVESVRVPADAFW